MKTIDQEPVDYIQFFFLKRHGSAVYHLVSAKRNLFLYGTDDTGGLIGIVIYMTVITEQFEIPYGFGFEADIFVA
ncbi:hypothetical protein F310043J5_26040 [Anaerostipes hominis (ex Lee et al. 2021)]